MDVKQSVGSLTVRAQRKFTGNGKGSASFGARIIKKGKRWKGRLYGNANIVRVIVQTVNDGDKVMER
ncbi:MAG: hypothetical protein QW231_06520 [Candidatus Bathyarchaeia archaeon]